MVYSKTVAKFIRMVPGRQLKEYRFLPFFFLLGATLEYSMINWTVGETNFYKTFKRRQAYDAAVASLQKEEEEKKAGNQG